MIHTKLVVASLKHYEPIIFSFMFVSSIKHDNDDDVYRKGKSERTHPIEMKWNNIKFVIYT